MLGNTITTHYFAIIVTHNIVITSIANYSPITTRLVAFLLGLDNPLFKPKFTPV
jgi:hypothetical protein